MMHYTVIITLDNGEGGRIELRHEIDTESISSASVPIRAIMRHSVAELINKVYDSEGMAVAADIAHSLDDALAHDIAHIEAWQRHWHKLTNQ